MGARVWAVTLLVAGVAMMALGAWLGASHVHADAGFVGEVDCGSAFSPSEAWADECPDLSQRKPAAIGLIVLGAVSGVGGLWHGTQRA
jgi:hypothetical protein